MYYQFYDFSKLSYERNDMHLRVNELKKKMLSCPALQFLIALNYNNINFRNTLFV